MTIAINLTHIYKLPGIYFIREYFLRIAASEPEHQFIFISASADDQQQITSKNCIHLISSPKSNNPLMWRIWIDYTLPGICRKRTVDLLINATGLCSLRTRVPQCLLISDLLFLYFPHFLSNNQQRFLKKNMLPFLKKATTIVTTSQFLTKELTQHYSIVEEKIKSFQLIAGDHYQPVGWEEKEAIKEKYTEGKEYFLFCCEIQPGNNLVNLLKAFSFFKRRQKSNMQLIITTKSVPANNSFIENFNTYKYRREVILLPGLPEMELAKITAGAYAFLYPVLYDGMAIFPLQAMQCEVPVITTHTGAIPEKAGDAVLYADPENFEDIADKMMLVFKDETRRSELIKTGKLIIQKINKKKKDNSWWKSILYPIN